MEKKILQILREIKAYIEYLIFTVKLDISLCDFYGRVPTEVSDYLSEYMIHPNLYCQKAKARCMKNCLRQQTLVKRKALTCNAPFFGACYAGVYEYVVPLIENNVYYGFISATGYRAGENTPLVHDPEAKKLQETYKRSLKTELPSEHLLNTLLSPLKSFFILLTYYYDANELQAQRKHAHLYQTLIQYISENYLRPLTMSVIAEELHYSASYLSHVFKERNNRSIMQYVHYLKIKKAKEFLRNTEKSITEISESLGFQDSNYFTNVFKKETGSSPRKFRAEQQRNPYPPLPPTQR